MINYDRYIGTLRILFIPLDRCYNLVLDNEHVYKAITYLFKREYYLSIVYLLSSIQQELLQF